MGSRLRRVCGRNIIGDRAAAGIAGAGVGSPSGRSRSLSPGCRVRRRSALKAEKLPASSAAVGYSMVIGVGAERCCRSSAEKKKNAFLLLKTGPPTVPPN